MKDVELKLRLLIRWKRYDYNLQQSRMQLTLYRSDVVLSCLEHFTVMSTGFMHRRHTEFTNH